MCLVFTSKINFLFILYLLSLLPLFVAKIGNDSFLFRHSPETQIFFNSSTALLNISSLSLEFIPPRPELPD